MIYQHVIFVLIKFCKPMTTAAEAIAEKLLQINAVKLNIENPYTWASGWRSPIYCDNRRALG